MNAGGAQAAAAAAALPGLLASSGALLEGHFLLSSGLHSPRYVQCARLLELPSRARQVGEWLAAGLAPLQVESVLSPALGGLIIGHEVAAALGVPFRFTERKEGRMELRRGFELAAGERVAIVEDVVTTGKSTLETVDVARAAGAEVVVVGAILDRTSGRQPFAAAPYALPLVALLALEFPSWPAAECPLCRQGSRPEKPGSRG